MNEVYCGNETNPQAGLDDMWLGGTMVDETGDTEKIHRPGNTKKAINLGKFNNKQRKPYSPPVEVANFNLTEGLGFPKDYLVILVLYENDDGDKAAAALHDLLEDTEDEVKKGLKAAGVGLGGPIGYFVGELAAWAYGELVDYINSLWGDIIFHPVTAKAHIVDYDMEWNDTKGKVSDNLMLETKAPGARYQLWYDWQLYNDGVPFPPVAFNPQDRFVVTMGNRIIVTTQSGATFGHDISGKNIGPAFQFTGAKVGFNPQDRFVVTIGNRIIVTTQSGATFGHDISGKNIGPAFQFTGAKVGFNPQDRFVVTIGNRIIVTTQSGATFGHDISGKNIGPAFQFTGAKVGFNPQDRFVVTIGNRIIVTTQSGATFGHDISGKNIGPAFQFTGAKVAFNPQDRFVETIGNRIIVTTQNGGVFGHDINGTTIGPAFQLN